MPGHVSIARFLLAEGAAFGAQRLSPAVARRFGQANRDASGEFGPRAQLRRHFDFTGTGWPIAAMAREVEAGDAEGHAWLRADPAWLRADPNGVRLMAIGPALSPTREDVEALLPALRPLFGDAGFALDTPAPARWYVRLPVATRIPAFPDPGDAVGADPFEDALADVSIEARKWRALASEVQVMLHNHPRNAQRSVEGKAPINALWFWGGGTLPVVREGEGRVHSDLHFVHGDPDPVVDVLAQAARIGCGPLPSRLPEPWQGNVLYNLRHLRDVRVLEGDWLRPALELLDRGRLSSLVLDLADGRHFVFSRWQRLRFWRRARAKLAP